MIYKTKANILLTDRRNMNHSSEKRREEKKHIICLADEKELRNKICAPTSEKVHFVTNKHHKLSLLINQSIKVGEQFTY